MRGITNLVERTKRWIIKVFSYLKRLTVRQIRKVRVRHVLCKRDLDLSKETLVYTLKVRKKLPVIIVKGSLKNFGGYIDNSAVFLIDFLAADGSSILAYKPIFRMRPSMKGGAYKYLSASLSGEKFSLIFKAPENAFLVKIKIQSFKKNIAILDSNTSISWTKLDYQNEVTKVIFEIEKLIENENSDGVFSVDRVQLIVDSIDKSKQQKVVYDCEQYFSDTYPEISCYLSWLLFRFTPSLYLADNVRTKLTKAGKMYELYDFIKEVDSYKLSDWTFIKRRIEDEINIFDNGFSFSKKNKNDALLLNKNILYLLHNSLPYNSGGYAARTHGLLSSINRDSPFIVHGISRPGYPSDHRKYISQKLPSPIPKVDKIDNVDYFRCDQATRRSQLTLSEYVEEYSEQIIDYVKSNDISIVHAASNYLNGLSAVEASRKIGIKSVYEVRGLWEVTRISRQADWGNTDLYKFMGRMETEACNNADAVITITKALKDLMVSRGVAEEKITVVPNCVDTGKFEPFLPRDESLAKKIGIKNDDVVIGYIGSIVNYEGLDDLFYAISIMKDKGIKKFKMLLVGDGEYFDHLIKLSKSLSIESYVIFTGRIPHAEVKKYYSLVDIAPFPRKPFLVCEIVSPLKPFEAMASGKAVLVSSCDALTEIVDNRKNGIVFDKGNIDDLADKLQMLIENKNLRIKLGEQASVWVRKHRDWKVSANLISNIYKGLLG